MAELSALLDKNPKSHACILHKLLALLRKALCLSPSVNKDLEVRSAELVNSVFLTFSFHISRSSSRGVLRLELWESSYLFLVSDF